MQVVLAEPAERDLAGIIDYIALDNPKAAESVFDAIAAALRRLAEFPEMGRAGRVPGTRELRLAGLPLDRLHGGHRHRDGGRGLPHGHGPAPGDRGPGRRDRAITVKG